VNFGTEMDVINGLGRSPNPHVPMPSVFTPIVVALDVWLHLADIPVSDDHYQQFFTHVHL